MKFSCVFFFMVLYFIVTVLSQIIDPYVEIEVLGIPADNCKRRTKTIMDNGTGMMMTMRLRLKKIANKN